MAIRRFKPKFRETLLTNARWLDFLDGGQNHAFTKYAQQRAEEANRTKRTQAAKENGARGGKVRADRKKEADVNREISALEFHGKLWRNNRGTIQDGQRYIKYGVGPNGASDFIGYVEIDITPEMVGQRFARFLAIEAKRPGENAREDQSAFIDSVLEAGGMAGVAHSGDEAKQIIGCKKPD